MKAVKKRLQNRNAQVQLLSLTVFCFWNLYLLLLIHLKALSESTVHFYYYFFFFGRVGVGRESINGINCVNLQLL